MNTMVDAEGLPADWQEHFDTQILERGRQYFKDGSVSCLERTADGYSAIVEGGNCYDVFVGSLNGEPVFECDCPYAEDGNNCKHMAAVCFAIEQNPKMKPSAKKKQDVFQLLEKADAEQMRSFLQKNVLVRREFANMFAVWVRKELSPKEFSACRNKMVREISAVLKKFQRYDYYDEFGYSPKIRAAVEASVGLMLKRGFLREAFLLVVAAVNCIMEWDDEGMCLDGFYDDLEAAIFSPLEIIVAENSDATLEREMFEWLAEQKDTQKWSFLDTVWRILMENFPGYTQEKLEALNKRIAEEPSGQFVLYKLDLMEELCYSAEDMKRVVEEGWEFPAVRNRSFESLYAKGDLRGAAEILLDSRTQEADSPMAVTKYTRQLRDLYEEMSDMEGARKEAHRALQSWGRSMDDFCVFKRLCSPDAKEIEGLLSGIQSYTLREDILCAEGMYEQLFKRLTAVYSVESMRRYESVLAERFSKEILAWYVCVVSDMAANVGDRKHYAEMADILVWMRRYDGGAEEANRLLAEWRAAYKRRPAMWDEFRKCGL